VQPSSSLELPANLVAATEEDGVAARWDWLERLPTVVASVAAGWDLQVGRPYQPGGQTAWVAPARGSDGADLVLKVGWRHPEAEYEADGLRLWAGGGAVLLHRSLSRGDTSALLLERCLPGHDLETEPVPEQDRVIAGLLQRLWVEPDGLDALPPLSQMCAAWADELESRPGPFLDPGQVRAGARLFRELPSTATSRVLLATDLHAGNVLAAERQPWLAIDPKPYAGDPTYDLLQHLVNDPPRIAAAPREVTDRFAGLCGVDADRLRLWLFARCVVEGARSAEMADLARLLAP